jgi:hypothetical protein
MKKKVTKRKATSLKIPVVGKGKADMYSSSLRENKVSYKRKKVGARSYMFTLNP